MPGAAKAASVARVRMVWIMPRTSSAILVLGNSAMMLSPILAAASNSTGGVMGKMIDAQSIVVACVATGQHGSEGTILRYVFFHSLALAILVGILVFSQAYGWPGVVP